MTIPFKCIALPLGYGLLGGMVYRTYTENSPSDGGDGARKPGRNGEKVVNPPSLQSETALCPLGHPLWNGICTDLPLPEDD